jgi:imidazolonepropionase-like amidohydrolase
MRRLTITLILAVILLAAATLYGQAPTPFAIEHVTVINVETGVRSTDQTVVVSGERITAVGGAATVRPPAGARIVDGRGKFLIPGIWDMHVHALRSPYRVLPLAVANGITGIRDMGATLDVVPKAREARLGGLVSPRLMLAGEGLDGIETPDRGLPPHPIVRTPAEGRAIIQRLAAGKVDFIKIHNGLKRDTYYAVVEEAKKLGLPFIGHLPPEVNIIEASDAGQLSIEHLSGLQAMCVADPAALRRPAPDASPNTQPIAINQAKCDQTIRHLARNGTWITPTVGPPAGGANPTRQFSLALIRLAAKGGIRLLAGTDWPGPGFALGNYARTDASNIMDELAGLVEAGLTPVEALRTATLNPAILFKSTDQLGSVERGKLADLLLLDADPLLNIANTKRIAAVVVNGRLIDAAQRQKLLDDEQAARRNEKRGN